MQIILIIIFVEVILGIILFLALSKKCVTYSDSAGNKGGGCFYIWQKGWWSREGLLQTAEAKGYKLLTNVSEFPQEYKEAINAVIDKLKSEENNPGDYYVKIKQAEEYDTNTIIIALIHKDTFEQKDPNKIIAGNPSGKDRNIYYNLDVKIITKDLFTR